MLWRFYLSGLCWRTVTACGIIVKTMQIGEQIGLFR